MRFASLSALFLGSGLVFGCGSTESPAKPADSGVATGDTAGTDTKPGQEAGSPVDISGALEITARVVMLDDAGAKVAQADFPARIENAAGGYIDSKSGADGIVKFKVDAAKGPFDLTIAKANHGVISVLALTGPAGDIVTYDFNAAESPTTNITGTISGKKDAANQVMADAWAWSTYVGNAATYTTKASNIADLPLTVAAIEVDSTQKIVNGVITPAVARTAAPMTINIAFPTTAVAATNKTINVKFPAAGPLAGAFTTVAEVTSDKHFGNALVVRSNKFAQMFVGVGKATAAASNSSTIALQVFGGEMAPDTVVVAWSGGEYFARANIKDLAEGATTTFGNVTALDVEGTDLNDFTFAADGTGYDYADVEIADTSGGSVIWRCYQAGPKIASRKLPHLPAATKLGTIAGESMTPRPAVVLIKRAGASATPWSENASYDLVVSKSTADALDPGGR